jgi:hypothetical protein
MSRNTVLRQGRGPSFAERLLAPLRAVGEISLLRRFGWVGGWGFYTPYTLDSSRVDYTLARALYRNTDDRYKLGAAFAKPIVNTTAGFMGAPNFTHGDEEADAALEDAMRRHTGTLLRINRNVLRDGDVFARWDLVQDRLNPAERTLRLRLVPPEWVQPILDPVTGDTRELVIRYPVKQTDRDGRETLAYTIVETLTATTVRVLADNRAPAEVQARNVDEANEWGFIPVVHFRNEPEEDQLYGASDLEPVEPYLRAYHDVMLSAVGGSKLFSRPKVKFQLKNVDTFLKNNFSADELRAGKVTFQGKDLFFVTEGEDISFVTGDSGVIGATTLLEFLFMCIVDVSETPEFAFGTAVASSKASVSEQMVPLKRKIARKRGQLEEPFGELASMYLAMWARVENKQLDTFRTQIEWDDVSDEDSVAVANAISTLANGLTTAMEAGILSEDAAAEMLRTLVPTMLPWSDPEEEEDEQRRVSAGSARRARLAEAAGLDEEVDEEQDDDDPPPTGDERRNGRVPAGATA